MKKAAGIVVLVLLAATMLTACSSSNSGGGSAASVISAKGGESTVGIAGYGGYGGYGGGGYFNVAVLDGNNIKITRSGSVDVSIDTKVFDEVISSATLSFGPLPLDVAANTTIYTYPSGTETGVTAGEFHMHVNNNGVYQLNGSGSDDQVSGLRIRPGATLTLSLNADLMNLSCNPNCGDTGYDTANVWFPYDVWNQGTITVMDLVTGKDDILSSVTNTADGTARDMGSITLNTSSAFLNDSSITAKGKDGSGETGGNGGDIFITAYKAVVNRGTI